MTNKSCNECKYWEQGELVDSGIKAADGNGNWHYRVGRCMNENSVHSEPPAWGSCCLFRMTGKGHKGNGRE